MAILSISSIRERNAALGHHFFDRATMRFFSSRVLSRVFPLPDGSALFVTSEDYAWQGKRRFFIRHAQEDGHVSTVSDFDQPDNGYASSDTAFAICADYQREQRNAYIS